MLSALIRRQVLPVVHKGWHLGTPQQLSCIAVSASARVVEDGSRSPQPRSCWPDRIVPTHTHAVSGLLRARTFHSSAIRFKKRTKTDEAPTREPTPKPAVILGLFGLIPFVAPPLIMAVTETYLPEAFFVQVAYGASVVSFLGGTRWGFALPESSPAKPDALNLAASVAPPLFAWGAIMFSDTIGLVPAAMMVINGLLISLNHDLYLLPTYPSWLKALWIKLVVVGFISLVASMLLSNYPEKRMFSEK